MNLNIELRPSRWLLVWLLLLYGFAAVICVVYLPLPLNIAALIALPGLLGWSLYRRIGLRGSGVVTGVSFDGKEWQLRGHGWTERGELRATVAWPFLVALQFRTPTHGRPNVLVMRDAVSDAEFSQLKVAARFAPVPE